MKGAERESIHHSGAGPGCWRHLAACCGPVAMTSHLWNNGGADHLHETPAVERCRDEQQGFVLYLVYRAIDRVTDCIAS